MLVSCNCDCCQRHRENPFNLLPTTKKSRFTDLDVLEIIKEFEEKLEKDKASARGLNDWPYAEDQATFDELKFFHPKPSGPKPD